MRWDTIFVLQRVHDVPDNSVRSGDTEVGMMLSGGCG